MDKQSWCEEQKKVVYAKARLARLEAAVASGILAEDDDRRKLFQLRYKPVDTEIQWADGALELLQTLIFCAAQPGWGNDRRGRKTLVRYAEKLQEAGVTDDSALEEETYNWVYLYLTLCHKDKVYNSVLFGLGQRKPESVERRMSQEIMSVKERFCDLPTSKKEEPMVVKLRAFLGEAIVTAFRDFWGSKREDA